MTRGGPPAGPDPVLLRHRIRWVLSTLVGLSGLASLLGCAVATSFEVVRWSSGEPFNGWMIPFASLGLTLGVLLLRLAYRSFVRPTATEMRWLSAIAALVLWGPVGWLADRVLLVLPLWMGFSSIPKNYLHGVSFLISSWIAVLVFRRLSSFLLAEPVQDQNAPPD